MKECILAYYRPYKKIRINFKNLLIYLAIYGLLWWLWIYVNGYMFMYMLIVFTIVPIYSIISLLAIEACGSLRLSMSDTSVIKDKLVSMGLIFDNNSIFATPLCKITTHISNDFYKTMSTTFNDMSVAPKGKSRTMLPLVFDKCGLVTVKISNIEIRDLLSIVSFIYDSRLEQRICVLPRDMQPEDINKDGYMVGLTQNEENNLKGNDFSDVSNIREYVPGDRIKDIHWKASARMDELMVKERVRLSENQLVMLVDLSGENDTVEKVISYSYNVAKSSLTDGIPVTLMWWQDSASTLQQYEIMNINDIKPAYMALYEDGISNSTAVAIDYIHNTMATLKKYVKVGVTDGEVKLIVME